MFNRYHIHHFVLMQVHIFIACSTDKTQHYRNRSRTVSSSSKTLLLHIKNIQLTVNVRMELSTVPVLLSRDPLGFWRVMLSEISLQRKHLWDQLLHIFPKHLSSMLKQYFFSPDVSLIKEFGPAFLNDVVHQIWLWNSLLRLSVLLKGFDLRYENECNILKKIRLNKTTWIAAWSAEILLKYSSNVYRHLWSLFTFT